MTGLEIALFFAVASACSGGVMLYLRKLQGRRILLLTDEQTAQVELSARVTYFGRQSKMGFEQRGNGVLVLNEDALISELLVGKTRLVIPRSQIREVRTDALSHGGMSKGAKPMLRIRYIDDEGSEQWAAWTVPDLYAWAAALTA